MKVDKLKREAQALAKARKHTLGRFKHTSFNVYEAWCSKCKRTILVDLRGPNFIWGGAALLDCNASRFVEEWERSRQLAFFKRD
jgi:hypothetical protein